MENGATNSYQYQPLQFHMSYFRLLRVNTDLSSSNVGDLVTFQLESAPPYYALSHFWGPLDQDTHIVVQEQHVSVSAEFSLKMRKLREFATGADPVLSPPLKFIWIDTLCINQQDATERGHQVQLMGQIYKRSVRTLIWLGPQDRGSAHAWRLMDDIYNIFRAECPTAESLDDIPPCMYSIHNKHGLPPWEHRVWNDLRRLFELRWFTRIWVIQEVVHSQKEPIIIHGDAVYSWDRLGWAASWLRRKGYLRLPHMPQSMHNVDALCSLRRAAGRGIHWPLDALISFTQIKFHATDQRDKVYSLLGLSAECQDPSNIPEDLRPDYNITVEQTYMKVGRFLLRQGGSLALLTRTRGTSGSLTWARRLHNLTDLPSWCPDWSDFDGYNTYIRTSFSWLGYSDTSRAPCLGFPRNYNASARLRLKMHDGDTGQNYASSLRLSGIRVTQLVHAARFNQFSMSKEQFYRSFNHTMRRILNEAASLLRTGQNITSWIENFVKATTAEQYQLSQSSLDKNLSDCCMYLTDLVETKDEIGSLLPQTSSGHVESLRQLFPNATDGNPENYVSLARIFCYNRVFFITSNGQMGIGPSDSAIGDTVAVMFGGGVPYLMRPHRKASNAWQLVGESYIPGLMHGEAIPKCEQGILREEIMEFW